MGGGWAALGVAGIVGKHDNQIKLIPVSISPGFILDLNDCGFIGGGSNMSKFSCDILPAKYIGLVSI